MHLCLQVKLLKDILEAWKGEVEKKPPTMSLEEAYTVLKLPKGAKGWVLMGGVEGYPGGVEGGSREETAHNVPGRSLHSPQAAKGGAHNVPGRSLHRPQAAKGRQRVGVYGRG